MLEKTSSNDNENSLHRSVDLLHAELDKGTQASVAAAAELATADNVWVRLKDRLGHLFLYDCYLSTATYPLR